jgi:hypothetical protein
LPAKVGEAAVEAVRQRVEPNQLGNAIRRLFFFVAPFLAAFGRLDLFDLYFGYLSVLSDRFGRVRDRNVSEEGIRAFLPVRFRLPSAINSRKASRTRGPLGETFDHDCTKSVTWETLESELGRRCPY